MKERGRFFILARPESSGLSPIELKRKAVFVLERTDSHWVLRIEITPYCQKVPCPGKKAFASPKKAVVPLFPRRASAVSARESLCLRFRLRKRIGRSRGGFSRPFLASAPAFLPGQQRDGIKGLTELEKILTFQ